MLNIIRHSTMINYILKLIIFSNCNKSHLNRIIFIFIFYYAQCIHSTHNKDGSKIFYDSLFCRRCYRNVHLTRIANEH